MRTCDICSTPIPFGTDRCPKCGYRYKPERKLNQEVRAKNKAEYMSQFQAHPSPLDEVKDTFTKTAGSDWTEIFKTTPKIRSQSYNQTTNTKKTIKRIVLIIVIASLLVTLIPIGIGIFLGVSDVFSDVVYVEEDYSYQWFESFDELEYDYPEIAKEVFEYRQFVLDTVDNYNINGDDYSIYETYNVYGNMLDYVYISHWIELDNIYVDIEMTKYSSEDDWVVTYSNSDYYDEGESVVVDEAILQSLATISGASYDEMVKCTNTFINDYSGENAYWEYPIDNGTFCIEYIDGSIFYSVYQPIMLY